MSSGKSMPLPGGQTNRNSSIIWKMVSTLFGILVLAAGVVNTFWGNDPFFGMFLILLSLVYFPPVTQLVKKWIGISVHPALKFGLALLIIWATVGVGELFYKIDLMANSVR